MSDINVSVINEDTSVVQELEKVFVTLQPEVNGVQGSVVTTEFIIDNPLTISISEIPVVVEVLDAPAPLVVVVAEQGPPGPTFINEMSDVWILSGPTTQVTLTYAPKIDTIKLFLNGLKEDSSVLNVNGVVVDLLPELTNFLATGDRVEFVYNYEV